MTQNREFWTSWIKFCTYCTPAHDICVCTLLLLSLGVYCGIVGFSFRSDSYFSPSTIIPAFWVKIGWITGNFLILENYGCNVKTITIINQETAQFVVPISCYRSAWSCTLLDVCIYLFIVSISSLTHCNCTISLFILLLVKFLKAH